MRVFTIFLVWQNEVSSYLTQKWHGNCRAVRTDGVARTLITIHVNGGRDARAVTYKCGFAFFHRIFRIVDCRALLKQYEESDDPDIADHLIESLSAARRHCWEELKSDELHTLKQEELSTDMSAWCCSTTIQVNTPVSQRQCHCCSSHPGC